MGYKNYFVLIKNLKREYPEAEILLFEGTEEGEKITDRTIQNISGIHKINTDLISVCNVFISGDTGALHIAAGLKVSTLALFGPSDPELVAPLNIESDKKTVHEYIWKKPYCSPCYNPVTVTDKGNSKYWRNGHFICHTGTHICMKEISTDEVFDRLTEIINKIR
ncbi:MAG: hypothetical protein IPL53_06950 [Ignavibacteria bacterium]|nr:hypothetical protein [Ignavibacteria bacterium]